MKILVTGASGFVGTHLCQQLLNRGHTVYGLARTPSKVQIKHERLTVIAGDLNSATLPWMNDLPNDLDACIHTAGLIHTFKLDSFHQVNALGTHFLIEALKKKDFLKFKFILVSSLAAAGPTGLGKRKNESDENSPVSFYGQSKKEAEEILWTHAPKEWISSVVRPPMVIGPGDAAVLDIFKMVRDGIILLPGMNAKMKEYSFVCVFDLVQTLSLLVESDLSLTLYSAHDSVVKFHELIEEIKIQMKKKSLIYLTTPFFMIKCLGTLLHFAQKIFPHELRVTPDKIHELKADAWTCEAKLSKSHLKQIYQYDLSRTIAVTLADYRERHWL